jgi:hypothetical protein
MTINPWTVHVSKAIALLNEARDLLERTTEDRLGDVADDLGPLLMDLEDWEHEHAQE